MPRTNWLIEMSPSTFARPASSIQMSQLPDQKSALRGQLGMRRTNPPIIAEKRARSSTGKSGSFAMNGSKKSARIESMASQNNTLLSCTPLTPTCSIFSHTLEVTQQFGWITGDRNNSAALRHSS